ncbi:hypothetical protein E3N88_43034 [Mikania micrantha]|uniref:Uncharacterized protein n=1 Tax=Mikania micrantha TaxID=192012 RepID=A0A5N6LG60_9ASTR|nr:hypothetical protein E3N88_43034 [Mikania micrantha]
MASNMSSRSRGCVPLTRNSKEIGTKLDENLNIFKSDRFDADADGGSSTSIYLQFILLRRLVHSTHPKFECQSAPSALMCWQIWHSHLRLLQKKCIGVYMLLHIIHMVEQWSNGAYTAAISQLMFSVIAQTSTDVHAIFGNALASSAAAKCVQLALGHCSLLEAHGLTLWPVLLKPFRPSVGQALDANLKRIEESTAALTAADD